MKGKERKRNLEVRSGKCEVRIGKENSLLGLQSGGICPIRDGMHD